MHFVIIDQMFAKEYNNLNYLGHKKAFYNDTQQNPKNKIHMIHIQYQTCF